MDRCIICNDSSIRPRSDSSWLIYDCLARCLEVVIDNEIMTEVEKLGDDKSLLSIYFRQNNSKRTEEKVLNKDNFDKVMEEISSLMPSTVSEAQNRIIEYVGNMSGLIGVAVQAGPHINLDLRMKATTFNFIRDHLKKDGSL